MGRPSDIRIIVCDDDGSLGRIIDFQRVRRCSGKRCDYDDTTHYTTYVHDPAQLETKKINNQ